MKTTTIAIQRPGRWDTPFGNEMTEQVVDQVLETPILRQIDAQRFPEARSLRDIIRNDSKLGHYRRGDIIVREGDYGSSVFVILLGTVRVLLDPEGKKQIAGRREPERMSPWNSLSQHWRRSQVPERRDVAVYQALGDTDVRHDSGDDARTYVKNVDRLLATYETARLSEGQMFGEIAALSRSPRTATIFAESDLVLVELRWQAVRDLRRRDPGFRAYVEDLYRSRTLITHLRETPLFRKLDEATLGLIAEQTLLESHGDLEWHGTFKEIVARDASEVVEHEPVIAEEGHYLDGLLIVRSGFARVSKRLDHGHRTIGYLTANEVFGLDEMVRHWRHDGELTCQSSLRAVGYVDLFRIPTALVLEHILPAAPGKLLRKLKVVDVSPESAWTAAPSRGQLEQPLLDALVDGRVINGQATMIINTDRCVGCDDCVTACAVTHDNNPRFVRHGPSHAHLMFTNACMHCVDPVCLIGCPTGAIHRNPDDFRVLIDDPTCIGCGTCADACPYDNIRMVEVRSARGGFIVDEVTRQPIVKATKCDLCVSQLGGPACARACPHDALIRIDMHDRKRLAKWINRSPSIARRIRNTVIAFAAGGLIVAANQMWEDSLRRANLLSGWILLALVVFLVSFAVRKKLPGLPLSGASSWLQAHVYAGFVCTLAFGLHGGWRLPTGVFESVLWLLFAFVAGSGVAGLALSRWLPPRMGRHGERVVFERIPGFRRQLAQQVEELAMTSVRDTASSTIADFYVRRLASFLKGPQGMLAHLVGSTRQHRRLRTEIHHLARYLNQRGCEILDEIEDCVAAKNNLDYQHALHLALRGWRYVHVPASYAAVLLIVVHIVLVLAFSGGPS